MQTLPTFFLALLAIVIAGLVIWSYLTHGSLILGAVFKN